MTESINRVIARRIIEEMEEPNWETISTGKYKEYWGASLQPLPPPMRLNYTAVFCVVTLILWLLAVFMAFSYDFLFF